MRQQSRPVRDWAATAQTAAAYYRFGLNQGAFLMRGLEKVRGEFSLTARGYNLRRVLNIVGCKS